MATATVIALLCSAAPALADSTGITGTVTDHATGQPIGRVQVNVLNASGQLINSTCTDASGQYTFGGLAPGNYRVGFESTSGDFRVCGGRTNYLPQYYQGAATLASATPVTVTAGTTVTGIDAALDPGGAIAGTVTNATDSSPATGVEVDAYDGSGTLVSSTCTESDGSYALFALATGDYHVEYVNASACGGATAYRTQYYSGQTSLTASDPIHVLVTQTTAGINAALIPTNAHTLTVTFAGTGGGSIQFSPYTVFCRRTCVLPLTGNQAVTLTASPSSGSTFAGWNGAGCSGTWTCKVSVGSDVAVTVTFNRGGAGAGGTPGAGGSSAGAGGPSGGGAQGSSAAAPKCTLSVVSPRIKLVRPPAPKAKGKRVQRAKLRPAVPQVSLRYRCDQPVRLTDSAVAKITTRIRATHGRRARARVTTVRFPATSWSTAAGTGTLAVTVPAAVLRAVRSHVAVSATFTLAFTAAHGSGRASASVARLRA